jgi:hypothetical protein
MPEHVEDAERRTASTADQPQPAAYDVAPELLE